MPGSRRRERASGRLASGTAAILDNGFNSLSNLLLTVSIARDVDGDTFGRFAIAYSLALFAVGLVRAAVVEPLLLNLPRLSGVARGAAPRAALRRAFFLGFGSVPIQLGVVMALSGLRLSWPVLAVVVVTPLWLVVDGARIALIANGSVLGAMTLSAVWLGTQAMLLLVVPLIAGSGALAAWLVGLLAALVCALWLVGRVPPGSGSPSDGSVGKRHDEFNRTFAIDFALGPGFRQLTVVAVAAPLSASDAGLLRLAFSVLGPAAIITQGLRSVGQRDLALAAPEAARRVAAQIALAAAGLCAIMSVFLVMLPADLLRAIAPEDIGVPDLRLALAFVGVERVIGGLSLYVQLLQRAAQDSVGVAWSRLAAVAVVALSVAVASFVPVLTIPLLAVALSPAALLGVGMYRLRQVSAGPSRSAPSS